MLYGYSREEIQKIADALIEGKTYDEAIDELYPKSEMQCIYECALKNMRSFSTIKAIYNAIMKKEQPKQLPCQCVPCTDCLS